jgi:DNA-binding MarR family transcriptional regulator
LTVYGVYCSVVGMADVRWYDDVPIPALMHQARGSYGDASRRSLAAIGCEDMPRRGGWVLAGLEDGRPAPVPQADAVRDLGVSKQASSQLIDTLVVRGYIERTVDPRDRRRMTVHLTERGAAAAAAIMASVDAVDAALAERITAEEMQGFRAGLAALADIRRGTG